MQEPLVRAQNLVVKYGELVAVNDINLSVNPGEVVGVLGGNGAGKSSTLRAVAGVNPPTSGELWIRHWDMSKPGQAELARLELGYCPDVGGLIRQATVREHIALALASRGLSDRWPVALDLLKKFDLLHVLDRETAGFSHGMSRRLSVILAALTSFSVLILDEPFDGVDPFGVQATRELISKAKDSGVAVLVSTHLLPLLESVSDRIIVMLDGTIVGEDVASKFRGARGAQRYEKLLKSQVR